MAKLIEVTNLNSIEIQEIIGQVPSWVIRWGITVVLFLVIVLVVVSHIIYYPDLVFAKGELMAIEQPFRISWFVSSPQEEYRCMVEEGDMVYKGQPLLLETTATEKNIFKAPFEGRVSLSKGYEKKSDKRTIWLIREVKNYEITLKILPQNVGKIAEGQVVKLSLDEYPEKEFGFLSAKVVSKLPVKIENEYRIGVELTNGMTTSKGINIKKHPNFTTTAEIICENKTIFNRIF